jgi:hypothetical protein
MILIFNNICKRNNVELLKTAKEVWFLCDSAWCHSPAYIALTRDVFVFCELFLFNVYVNLRHSLLT